MKPFGFAESSRGRRAGQTQAPTHLSRAPGPLGTSLLRAMVVTTCPWSEMFEAALVALILKFPYRASNTTPLT